jgi:hypothetical protein
MVSMLEIEYHKGFNVVKSDKPGPVFVAPHSTLSYRSSEREDVGSENVAFLAVDSIGGAAVISSVPRLGILGVDYNRIPPDFNPIKKGFTKISDELKGYYKKYAFTSESEKQFITKSNTYKAFWTKAEELGKKNPFFIFCHTLSARLKNLPVAIDLVTGRGRWTEKSQIEKIAKKLNRKYDFRKYMGDIKEHNYFWLLLYRNFIRQNFGSLARTEGMTKEWLAQDIANANALLGTSYKLNELDFELYRNLMDRVFENIRLKITVEALFHGDMALAVPPLLKRTGGRGLEIESLSYLNEVQPGLVVKIIKDIVDSL